MYELLTVRPPYDGADRNELVRKIVFEEPRLPTRIGVSTNRALAGNVGAAERFNYTVLGLAVAQAEDLEQLNKELGTTVLISGPTARAVGDQMSLRSVGTFEVDGETMEVFELLGEAS